MTPDSMWCLKYLYNHPFQKRRRYSCMQQQPSSQHLQLYNRYSRMNQLNCRPMPSDMPMLYLHSTPPIPTRRLDSAKKGGIKMQKSGIKFWELMPRTIVPLDSAFVNLVYAMYSTAFSGFLQVIKLGVKEYIKQKTTPPCGHPCHRRGT